MLQILKGLRLNDSIYDQMIPVKFFSAQGRMSSRDYFSISMPLSLILYFLFRMVTGSDDVRLIVFGVICLILLSVLQIYATIKRLHDLNLTGWLAFSVFLPYLCIPVLLVLWFRRGEKHANGYGKNPYSID